MLRIVVILSLLGLLVLPNVPALVGLMYWWEFDSSLELLELQCVDVLRNEHHLGWRTSTIETELGFASVPEAPRFKFVTEVHQGPFADDSGTWHLIQSNTRLYVDDEPVYPPAVRPVIRSYVGLDRASRVVLDFPPFERAYPELDLTFVFGGLHGYYDDAPGSDVAPFFRYDIGASRRHVGDIALRAGAGEGTLTMTRSRAGNLLTDDVLRLESIRLTDATDQTLFGVSAIEIVNETDETRGLIAGSSTIHVERLTITGVEYGPLDLQLVAEGWADSPLYEATREMRRLQARTMTPEETLKALRAFWYEVAWSVFSGHPSFAIDPFTVESSAGRFEARARLAADGIAQDDIDELRWLEKIELDLEIGAPEGFFWTLIANAVQGQLAAEGKADGWYVPENVPAINAEAQRRAEAAFASLRQSGFFRRTEDERLVATITIEDGILAHNGRPLGNPAQWLAPVFQQTAR